MPAFYTFESYEMEAILCIPNIEINIQIIILTIPNMEVKASFNLTPASKTCFRFLWS